MGLSDELIEMLFVHPAEQGKGCGKQLIQYALHEKYIYKVDVNEQNESAHRFYQHTASGLSEEMKPTLREILFPYCTCNGSRKQTHIA